MFKELLKSPLLEKKQVLILPAISVVICLLLLFLIIIPQLINFFNSNKLISQEKERFSLLNEKINQLGNINLPVFKENLDVALIALPAEKDVPGSISQILFLLGKNSLKLDTISLSTVVSDANSVAGVASFNIKLAVSGDATALKNFISNLNKTPRLMKITGLEVSTRKDNSSVQADMNITAYYESLPTTISDLEKPVPQISSQENQILLNIRNATSAVPVSSFEVFSQVPKGKQDPFQ